MTVRKALSIILAVILVLNLAAVALRIIPALTFWIVLAIAAITAFKILPKMKK